MNLISFTGKHQTFVVRVTVRSLICDVIISVISVVSVLCVLIIALHQLLESAIMVSNN